jgi:four helix bundle protein
MAFMVFEYSIDMVRCLRGPLFVISRRDQSLVSQLRRAAASVSLNIAEGNRRVGRDRTHLWRVAAGSANEVIAGLRIAEAFGWVSSDQTAACRARANSILGMLRKLTR